MEYGPFLDDLPINQGHEIGTLAPHVAPALGVVFHAKLRTIQTAP